LKCTIGTSNAAAGIAQSMLRPS